MFRDMAANIKIISSNMWTSFSFQKGKKKEIKEVKFLATNVLGIQKATDVFITNLLMKF